MKKCLLIDIDGTITHDPDYSPHGFVEFVLRDILMEKHKINSKEALDWVCRLEKRSPGIGMDPFYAVRHCSLGVDERVFLKRAIEAAKNRLTVFKDAAAGIKNLYKSGYKMFIASNNSINRALIKLKIAGLGTGKRTKYFEHIYGRDIIGCSKDNPEFFRSILERENFDGKNVVMIGDSETADGYVPFSAGIKNCIIVNRSQKEPIIKKAFYTVNSFEGIPQILDRLVKPDKI